MSLYAVHDPDVAALRKFSTSIRFKTEVLHRNCWSSRIREGVHTGPVRGGRAQICGALSLADLERKDSEAGDLKDRVADWIQVIDRWIQDIDRGMGGAAEGADPTEMPDSAPEPTSTISPAVDTG